MPGNIKNWGGLLEIPMMVYMNSTFVSLKIGIRLWLGLCASLVWLTSAAADAQPAQPSSTSYSAQTFSTNDPESEVWVNGIGSGFRSTAQSLSLQLGASVGVLALGGVQHHDLALASLSYGHMLGPMHFDDHWYRGNVELRGEVFGGEQFSPSQTWIVGFAPHLRYNFITGTHVVPFFDIGMGMAWTGIGVPDLGGTFEFNLQALGGVHWFVRDNLAITADVRYLHISSGGIHNPNLGVNTIAGMIGVSWFF